MDFFGTVLTSASPYMLRRMFFTFSGFLSTRIFIWLSLSLLGRQTWPLSRSCLNRPSQLLMWRKGREIGKECEAVREMDKVKGSKISTLTKSCFYCCARETQPRSPPPAERVWSPDARIQRHRLDLPVAVSQWTKILAVWRRALPHLELLLLLVIATCIVAVLKGLTSSGSSDIAAGLQRTAQVMVWGLQRHCCVSGCLSLPWALHDLRTTDLERRPRSSEGIIRRRVQWGAVAGRTREEKGCCIGEMNERMWGSRVA